MQPPVLSTTRRICATSRSTGARVSMASAVPAGDVMARDDVLGMRRPQAAMMGTMIMVVRLPGSPPTQCLSITGPPPQAMRSPAFTMARVRAMVSSRSRWSPAQAVTNAASCRSE